MDVDGPILSMFTCPDEVLQLITSFLPNRDVKNARLAHRRLRAASSLRLERVFISPSYRNLEVLRAVAGHDELRGRVREIVWDDARFMELDDYREEGEEGRDRTGRINIQGYEFMCENNFDAATLVRGRTGAEPKPGEKFMTLEENFALYIQLFKEQEEIIRAGLDVAAFRTALRCFPMLQRVVLTSEAHMRQIQAPRYPTPLLRAVPPSFDYPGPSAWLGGLGHDWVSWPSWEEGERENWRGFNIILEALSTCPTAIPELVIDVNGDANGIGYHFFQGSSPDFRNFEAVCRRGLRRLDLAVNVAHDEGCVGMSQLHAGPLEHALATATAMEHFSLHTSANTRHVHNRFDEHVPFDGTMGSRDVLQAIPIRKWPCLTHLTLSHIAVTSPQFLCFLGDLPPSIRYLRLIDLKLFEGTWAELLQRMRDDNGAGGWMARKPRPSITIAHSRAENQSRKVWIQREIAAFLDGGENPFVGDLDDENEIQWGFGVVRDDWDEAFEEPWEMDR
jgi:hypothetical protein